MGPLAESWSKLFAIGIYIHIVVPSLTMTMLTMPLVSTRNFPEASTCNGDSYVLHADSFVAPRNVRTSARNET